MRLLTGQDVLVKAVDTLAGEGPRGPRFAEAVRIMHLRELRPGVDALGEQVGRWYRGEVRTPDDVALRALDALGAINWDRIDQAHPGEERTTGDLAARRERARGALTRAEEERDRLHPEIGQSHGG